MNKHKLRKQKKVHNKSAIDFLDRDRSTYVPPKKLEFEAKKKFWKGE